MKNYKIHVSEGFKDTYGKEMLVKKEIEYRVLNTFKSYGYEHIKTPGLEYIDVYSLNGLQKPDLYNLINRQGEVLSLCNDMTASIARFYCSNPALAKGVKKYCYIADTFRYPRLYQGKNHQFLQAGVEFLGEKGISSDAGVIYLAYKTLKSCNVSDFTIHLGSTEFLTALFEDYGFGDALVKSIYKCIDDKDYVTLRSLLLAQVDEEKASFIIDLMLKGGKLRYMDNLILKLDGMKAQNVLVYLKKVYQTLRELNVDNIIFDFSIYSYAEYYTGIIFNVYADHVGKAVINGGRCDSLFAKYGKDIADIGFGIDIDALTGCVLEKNLIDVTKEKYLAYAQEEFFVKATIENDRLRDSGILVSQVSFSCVEEALDYAKEHGFDKVIEYTKEGNRLLEVK